MRSTPPLPSPSRSKSFSPTPATSVAADSSCTAAPRARYWRSTIAKPRRLERRTTCIWIRPATRPTRVSSGTSPRVSPVASPGCTQPWPTLLAPAIRLANGHIVDSARSRDIGYDRELLVQFPASRAQFLPNDSAPAPGTLWKQTDLARTLQLISDSGPDVFYRGQIADLIVAEMQRGGGVITKNDLRAYHAKWRTPVELTYRGYTIYSMPPPSSGGVTMGEILNILEGYDTIPALGTPAYEHLLAEAMRRAFIDRNHWLGDPDFVQ